MTTPDAAAKRRDPFTPVHPDDESAVLDARLAEWERAYAPEPGYPHWVMSRVVLATVRLDRNMAHESGVRTYEAGRADLCWDDDRRLEAEDLGAKIHKDPAKVRRRLEDTPQGADWLIERWDALARIAATGREWSEPQEALALDLLGISPALRDGPTPFEPTPASQASFARAERQRLERLRERVLAPGDEHERALAVSGISLRFSPVMVRVRREEAFWTREYHRAFAEFRRVCLKPSDPPALRPAPTPPPREPEPELEPAFDPSSLAPSHAEFEAMDRMIMAQLMQARQDRGVEDPFEVVDFREPVAAPIPVPVPVPVPVPLLSTTPAPSGNRRLRRAQEARQRSRH